MNLKNYLKQYKKTMGYEFAGVFEIEHGSHDILNKSQLNDNHYEWNVIDIFEHCIPKKDIEKAKLNIGCYKSIITISQNQI